jgi:hypothetical protein
VKGKKNTAAEVPRVKGRAEIQINNIRANGIIRQKYGDEKALQSVEINWGILSARQTP